MDTTKPTQPSKQGKTPPKPATVEPAAKTTVIGQTNTVARKTSKPICPVDMNGEPIVAVGGAYSLTAALVCDGPLLAKTPNGGSRHSEPRSIPTGEKYVVLASGESAFIRTGVISLSGVGEWQAVANAGLVVLEPVLAENFEVIVPVVVYGSEPQSIFTTTQLATFTLGEDDE